VGKGRILYVPDVTLIENQNVDKADHLSLLLWMISDFKKAVWFDETVHSWLAGSSQPPDNPKQMDNGGIHEPSVGDFFSLIRVNGWFVLIQLGLFVFLWLFARGKRFAAPRREGVKEKRNALEYIEAMARWYQRLKLEKELLLHMHDSLRKEIVTTLRLPKHVPENVFFDQLEMRLGKAYRVEYERIARSLQKAINSKQKIPPKTFMEWGSALRRLRKELNQWKVIPPTSTMSKP
jgi:hypothetical protein